MRIETFLLIIGFKNDYVVRAATSIAVVRSYLILAYNVRIAIINVAELQRNGNEVKQFCDDSKRNKAKAIILVSRNRCK